VREAQWPPPVLTVLACEISEHFLNRGRDATLGAIDEPIFLTVNERGITARDSIPRNLKFHENLKRSINFTIQLLNHAQRLCAVKISKSLRQRMRLCSCRTE
jgi:hypothetical protein